jgi:RNA recognition motif-containing protein|tara:strand:- start:596 stop:817 length:222 start_codon:yes stop_codon:yes gene_type:complete
MTEDELEALFAEHGAVTSANIITDKYSGRSRGFGFVEMEDDAAAEAAIEALNETEHSGRALRVNQAKPREDRN